MNTSAEKYFIHGCGRCPLGGTTECKVHTWDEELALLRSYLIDSELTEECKWGVPCYTFNGKNVILLSAFKEYCSIGFLKGVLLKDEANILSKPGEHSQSTRLLKINSMETLEKVDAFIPEYIQEIIAIEKSGKKVAFKKEVEPYPEELEAIFEEDPVLESAFESLTPGRQRGYIIYFSQPKQSKTRTSRIEKCIDKIMKGEGLHDKYKSRKK